MLVKIDYSDGRFSMRDVRTLNFKSDWSMDRREEWIRLNTIEMSEAEWCKYRDYLELERYWQSRMLQLDQQILRRKEG